MEDVGILIVGLYVVVDACIGGTVVILGSDCEDGGTNGDSLRDGGGVMVAGKRWGVVIHILKQEGLDLVADIVTVVIFNFNINTGGKGCHITCT